ncbi:MAG: hypothetical protein HY390_07520 [Deltaproteobacteria bacterium]|nr:hypothetical protein [Deltaproteobacteria bacterium]
MKLNLCIGVMIFLLLPWLEVHEVLGEMQDSKASVQKDSGLGLPMDGDVIDIDQMKGALFFKFGHSQVTCMDELIAFLSLWNQRQLKTQDIDWVFNIIFTAEFKKAMSDFEHCTEKFGLVTEDKALEAVLGDQDDLGFPRARSGRYLPSVKNEKTRKSLEGKREASLQEALTNGSLPGAKRLERNMSLGEPTTETTPSAPVSDFGSTTSSGVPLSSLTRGTLARNSANEVEQGLIGATSGRGGSPAEPQRSQQEAPKVSKVDILRGHYDQVSVYEDLESKRLLAVSQGRDAEVMAMDEAMTAQRHATKEALLSILRTKGLSRKIRLNAFEKWRTLEGQDNNDRIPADVYMEAMAIVADWNHAYEKGLDKGEKELAKANSLFDTAQACLPAIPDSFKPLGDLAANDDLAANLEKINEEYKKLSESKAPKILMQPKNQVQVENLIHAESVDAGSRPAIAERDRRLKENKGIQNKQLRILTDGYNAAQRMKKEREETEGNKKLKEKDDNF